MKPIKFTFKGYTATSNRQSSFWKIVQISCTRNRITYRRKFVNCSFVKKEKWFFSKKNCWQSLFSLVKCKSTSQITIHSLKRRVNFDDLQKRVLIGEKGQGSEKLKMASENKLLISKQFRLSTRYHVHQVNKDLDKRWDIKNQLYFEKRWCRELFALY